jgi:hypothetical protein
MQNLIKAVTTTGAGVSGVSGAAIEQASTAVKRRPLHRIFITLMNLLGVSVSGNGRLVTHDPDSGNRRTSLITPREFEGGRYLVSGGGESRWVRGLRATGEAELKLGRRTEEITVVELDDEEKLPVLRWYATCEIEAEGKSDKDLLKLPVFKIDPPSLEPVGGDEVP